jgi:hypothetical protein
MGRRTDSNAVNPMQSPGGTTMTSGPMAPGPYQQDMSFMQQPGGMGMPGYSLTGGPAAPGPGMMPGPTEGFGGYGGLTGGQPRQFVDQPMTRPDATWQQGMDKPMAAPAPGMPPPGMDRPMAPPGMDRPLPTQASPVATANRGQGQMVRSGRPGADMISQRAMADRLRGGY